MGLAVPTAVMVASGRGAAAGVLIKGGEPLERLAAVDTVVFDKTGTLTEGHAAVVGCDRRAGQDRDAVLRLIAAVEARSEHPLAKAIVAFTPRRAGTGGRRRRATSRAVAGRGVVGDRRRRTRCSSAPRRCSSEIGHRHVTPFADTLAVVDGEAQHAWCSRRSTARRRRRVRHRRHACVRTRAAVVESLRRRGLRVVMLSGDRQATADGDREAGRHRRGDRRGAARRQGRGDQVAAGRRAPRRDGRRRPQRRAGARAGRRRHRHGVGHRHRGRSRVGHADAQRSRRRRAGDRARAQDDGGR